MHLPWVVTFWDFLYENDKDWGKEVKKVFRYGHPKNEGDELRFDKNNWKYNDLVYHWRVRNIMEWISILKCLYLRMKEELYVITEPKVQ